MALHLVLLSTILAFSLASTEQCVSSPGFSTDLSLHSMKNASGHWIITVDTRRLSMKENPRELSVDVHQETRICGGYETEQLFSISFVYPSLHEGERKTWNEAREQCMRDGGDLMVMETERERDDMYIPLYNSVEWWSNYSPWVGVYIPQGEGGWKTVKGEPFLSTWWWPGDPDNYADGKCAYAIPNSPLMNYDCAYRLPFICEISL